MLDLFAAAILSQAPTTTQILVSPEQPALVARSRPVRRNRSRAPQRYGPPAPRRYSCYNVFNRRRDCTNEKRERPGKQYDPRVPRLSDRIFDQRLFVADNTPPLPPGRIGCGTNPFCNS